MHILITGAAGFLGSHLALRHMSMGDTVTGFDNFSSSKPNSGHLKQCLRKGMDFYDCDISTDELFDMSSRTIDQRGVDIIYNFACPASPPIYQSIPIQTMMTCVVGTKNVLDLASYFNARVVHASTSEVYGDPDFSPQYEEYRGNVNSYGPRSCYDEGKRAAEALVYDYNHTGARNGKRVDARLVRIFNTYGPHMCADDGRVVSNFICQALRKQPITLYGMGQQSRSFCYVDDLIDGIIAMGAKKENPGRPINIGNPHEFTINELSQCINRKLGPVEFVYRPMPVDDPKQRCPNIRYAKSILGWQPKVELSEGLDRTIEYFKSIDLGE